ncbi:MAG: hypothetical protein QME40_04615 [bacterium]|nr:hypothetical protein [bacterium]
MDLRKGFPTANSLFHGASNSLIPKISSCKKEIEKIIRFRNVKYPFCIVRKVADTEVSWGV